MFYRHVSIAALLSSARGENVFAGNDSVWSAEKDVAGYTFIIKRIAPKKIETRVCKRVFLNKLCAQ